MRKTFLLLALLGFAQISFAEPIKMLSLLGAPKYKKVAVDNAPSGYGIALFTSPDTFGDGKPVVQDLIAAGKTPVFKLETMWKDGHNFSRSDFPKIINEIKRFVPLIKAHPDKKFYIIPATEHNLNQRDAQDLVNQALAATPDSVQIINNPWVGRGSFIPTGPRVLNEVHGSAAQRPNIGGRYSVDMDGSPSEDINIQAIKDRFPDAEIFSNWSPRFNCHWEMGSTVPRPQRKGCPDGKMIKSIAVLANPKGKTNFSPKFIYKSHSENKGTGDSRAEKPVLIVGIKAKSLTVGGVSCPYYGLFADGRSRFYCPKFGYEIATVPVQVKNGNKLIGTVNPSFRDGSYR